MARLRFGGTAADVAEDMAGGRVPGAIGTIWDGPSEGANRVFDALDESGATLEYLVADNHGMIPAFQGPDGGPERMWLDFGAGRVAVLPTDVGERLRAHQSAYDPHGSRTAIESLFGQPGGISTLNSVQKVPLTQLPTDILGANAPGPREHNFLTWSVDPATGNGATAPVSGVLQLARVRIVDITLVSSVTLSIATPGAGLTAGRNLVGLYDSYGYRWAISADQSASWATAGEKTINFTVPNTEVYPGAYWVAILSVGTTPPSIARISGTTLNMGLPVNQSRFGTYGTALTSMPTSFDTNLIKQSSAAYVVGLR